MKLLAVGAGVIGTVYGAHLAAGVSCIAAALYRCGADPIRLADDGRTLRLMCTAITEGFAALRGWANCASPLTRDTPKPRCAPLHAMLSPELEIVGV